MVSRFGHRLYHSDAPVIGRPARRRISRLLAAFGTAAMTATVGAASASAPLSVGVTVVRSCSVESAQTSGSIGLACSASASRIQVSSSGGSEVLTLASGIKASLDAGGRTGEQSGNAPRQITINF